MTHRKLKYLRQILGLTQNEMADGMGITQGFYCKLEANRITMIISCGRFSRQLHDFVISRF